MEKLPAQMTVIGISKPGGPEVLLPETRAVPGARAGRNPGQGRRPPASTVPTSRSAPAPIRRRPAPAICPALKLRAKSSRSAPALSGTSSATR